MMTYSAHREAQAAREARLAQGMTSMSSVGNGGDDYAARLILSATLADSGGTFTPDGKRANLTTGYMVGMGNGEAPAYVIPLALADRPAAVAAVRDAMARVRRLNPVEWFIGAWVHDGMVYVEVSRWFVSRRAAEWVATARGEHSIWDNANAREVLVD